MRPRCFLLLRIRDERISAILDAEKCSCLSKPLRRNEVEEIPEAATNITLKIMEESPGLGGIERGFLRSWSHGRNQSVKKDGIVKQALPGGGL